MGRVARVGQMITLCSKGVFIYGHNCKRFFFTMKICKGPFKYYVIKGLGGWGKVNDYDWLQGWVTGFGSI